MFRWQCAAALWLGLAGVGVAQDESIIPPRGADLHAGSHDVMLHAPALPPTPDMTPMPADHLMAAPQSPAPAYQDAPSLDHGAPTMRSVPMQYTPTTQYAPATPYAPVLGTPGAVSASPYGTPGGYEARIGSPYYYHTNTSGQHVVTGNPYYDHYGPGFHRHSLHGHYRFPYYSYRAPWYFPGRAVYNRDTNYAW